ncbi:ABC transporter permease [Candidatus Micrarchaeota archaeon]|nr:ABC transporter permease [Candidatus Micrarchaeota archaeon]
MKSVSAIRKELLEVLHDRTMLAVLLVFPVFVMLFMGTSFRSMEINGLPIGLAGPENVSASPLFSGLNQSQAFKLQEFTSEEDAMTEFRNGRLRAVIIVPQDFEESLRKGNGSTVRVVVDNSDLALEQSVLAALSSVIEASSTDITKSYVASAWEDLQDLNGSTASLASGIAQTRSNMNQTKASLAQIRQGIDEIEIDALEASLDGASSNIAALRNQLESQKAELADVSAGNEELFNETDAFLYNASFALNESKETVQGTHERLGAQVSELNGTVSALSASILGLEAIRAGTTDPVVIAALDLNIASLESLQGTTEQQIIEAQAQMADLRALNITLHSFGDSLEAYSAQLETARADSGKIGQLGAALDNVSLRLSQLNASFSSARSEVVKLKGLLSGIKGATSQIDGTLDDALAQTASVDALIGSLQATVAEQTGKDPDTIASPLSVSVENQYGERSSYVDFIMPQVIAVSLLFSCFLLGSISLVREKTHKTIIRALLAPGALTNMVVGKIAALMLMSFVQVAMILLVALLLFGVKPPESFLMLLWGTAISSLVLSSIGLLVGFYARSESAAIQSCLLLAIPMLFLGNIIFSPDLLPVYTQILQQLLPLSHVTSIFKVVLITNGDPAGDIAALLSYFVLLAMLMSFIIFKRRDITNYI